MALELPVSFMQKAALRGPAAGHQTNPRLSVSFGENIQREAWLAAWNLLVRRHPMLRTAFTGVESGAPSAVEGDSPGGVIEEPDWSAENSETLGERWKALLADEAAFVFGERPGIWWRMQLIALPGGASHMLFSFHRALFDEESVAVLLREGLGLYERMVSGEEPSVQPTPSYAGVIGAVEVSDERAADFWKRHFDGFAGGDPFAFLAEGRTDAGGALTAGLDEAEVRGLGELGEKLGIGLDAVIAAAWGNVLSRCGGRADGSTGLLRSVRGLAGDAGKDVCGLFTAVVPQRFVQREKGCDLAAALRAAAADHREMETALLADVEAITGVPMTGQFQSVCYWRPDTLNDRIRGGMPRWLGIDAQFYEAAVAPVTLRAEGSRRLSISLDCVREDIARGALVELLRQTVRALRDLAAGSSVSVDSLAGEIPRVENEETAPPLGAVAKLVEELAATARRHPDLAAVELGEDSISHTDLDIYSNQLAHYIRQKRPKPHTRVGVCMTDTPWLPVALVSLLKEGGGLVWLDPARLPDAVADLTAEAGVELVVADSAMLPLFDETGVAAFALDQAWEEIAKKSGTPPRDPGRRPAAVFTFLEGWDAEARPVSIPAESLAAAALASFEVRGLEPGSRMLQIALRAPAQVVEDCLVCALAGATLVQAAEDPASNRTAFEEALENLAVTHVRLPAAFWAQWVQFVTGLDKALPPELRVVLIDDGGFSGPVRAAWDALAGERVRLDRGFGLWGLLGLGLWRESAPSDHGPLRGVFPVGGVRAIGVDPLDRPLPAGYAGRLALRFTGVDDASGVAPVPVAVDGEPLFLRTAQTVVLDQEGRMRFLDSHELDRQLEIDASERLRMENALCAHPRVLEAKVDTHESLPPGALCAWVVLRDIDEKVPSDLPEHLTATSPGSPRIEYFAAVQRFPLDREGRIDRALLGAPEKSGKAADAGSRTKEGSGAGEARPERAPDCEITVHRPEGGGPPVVVLAESEADGSFLNALLGALPDGNTVVALTGGVRSQESGHARLLEALAAKVPGFGPDSDLYLVADGTAAATAVRIALRWESPVRLALIDPQLPVDNAGAGQGETGLRKAFRLFLGRRGSSHSGNARKVPQEFPPYPGPVHVFHSGAADETLLRAFPHAVFETLSASDPEAVGSAVGKVFVRDVAAE